MATATVPANTKSAQVKSTRKPAASTTPQAEESRKSGTAELVDIIEQVSLYAPEVPLTPSQVSKLYDAAESLANLARTMGGSPEEYADLFATRLALLRACLEASKSGKLDLPKEETKRCAGIVAVKMLREIREWSDCVTEEGRETLAAAIRVSI